MMRIVVLSFFALIGVVSPALAQNANPLPAGDGRDIVSVACSQCHYLGTIAKIRDGAAGWRAVAAGNRGGDQQGADHVARAFHHGAPRR